ncbi:hypothetical protein H376_5210 [Rickettsia prowazekii str. GvF12]|nr:hypothetical protein H376_5210 [Rickettsia prowazekii str. GvF12]
MFLLNLPFRLCANANVISFSAKIMGLVMNKLHLLIRLS